MWCIVSSDCRLGNGERGRGGGHLNWRTESRPALPQCLQTEPVYTWPGSPAHCDHGHTSGVTPGVSLNMDGDKNGGHNGPGPGPAKPDPQEANNSYTTKGVLNWCWEELFELDIQFKILSVSQALRKTELGRWRMTSRQISTKMDTWRDYHLYLSLNFFIHPNLANESNRKRK